MSDKEIVGQTMGGKNIIVEYDKKATLYRIKFSPGGEVPKDLGGLWTSKTMAQKAIDLYLAKMEAESLKKNEEEEANQIFEMVPEQPTKKRGRPVVNG